MSGYGLITKNYGLQPYTMLFAGLLMLIVGLIEFKKERKEYGYLSIIVSIFLFFVSFQGFLLN
ncbi:YczI family protein [Alkalihalobacillus deserti]|uniref:YczI family protein n=1 Tax=Alkalihalobacillus deserti TaxID=2879466 RepID=UPI0027DF5848|nr:YczI family protein [Alkalihalobacillus deserti]